MRTVAQCAEVETRASACATFYHHVGVTCRNASEQLVVTKRQAVIHFALSVRAQMSGIMLVHAAVVVPLDVVDVVIVQYRNHLVVDIVHYVVTRHIQMHLVSTEKHVLFVLTQGVVGVRLKQIGGEVDHLRFKPYAKLDPLGVAMVNHLAEVDFVGVYLPVAKSVQVVVASSEPTVVKHKQFRADFLGIVNVGKYTVGGKCEVASLPRVEKHGFVLAVVAVGDNVVTHEIVHVATHTVYAVSRVAHHGLRSNETFAVGKYPRKILVIYSVDNVRAFHHVAVSTKFEVAAVNKIES